LPLDRKSIITGVLLLLALAVLGWSLFLRPDGNKARRGKRARGPAPVEVTAVQRGAMELTRTYSGTLEASARFTLAPKVGGMVLKLYADIGDRVRRGQVVAELDDAEYVQAVAQAKAELLVAQANQVKTGNDLTIAKRDYQRAATLRKRGVASDAQLDEAESRQQAAKAQFEVAKAQMARAQASLQTANIRLGYTKVTASWSDGDEARVVAERQVDEGETVAANAALMTIVELKPLVGAIFVAERDYPLLKPGQKVSLTTDAYPATPFLGFIDRIAPVFQKNTRQARVELSIPNQDRKLKPGMFTRVQVVLRKIDDAVMVPELALTERNDRQGVFVLGPEGKNALWRPVKVGIRRGGMAQVTGLKEAEKVITVGQHMLDHNSPVMVVKPAGASVS
jgi:RND family efflux transporter MFP subunit